MKKFAEGGRASRGQARYDRMMKDIESDYAKKKDRPGRAGEVAKAKYEQRMADAKDDLAKARGEDRSQTRAAEKAAERNLTTTRKYGATKSVVKADDVAKVGPMDDLLKSAPKPQMPSKSEAKPTRRATPAPTRRAPAKQEEKPTAPVKPAAATPAAASKGTPPPKPAVTAKTQPTRSEMARERFGRMVGFGGTAKADAATRARTDAMRADQAQRARWSAVETQGARDAKLYQLKAAAEAPGASQFAKDRYRMAKETGRYASGGTVKKKSSTPTQKPPQPSAADREASKRQDESFKTIKKVSPSDIEAMNRSGSSGKKAGGTVKKYAAGGLTKIMPTANEMGNLGMAKGGKVKKGGSFRASANGIAKKGTTKAKMPKMAGGGKCYAKGGSVSSRADGIARKGKTNCKTC